MTRLLELDRQALAGAYGRESMALHHHLIEHPLLGLEPLARLADFLPASSVEHNIGALPTVAPGGEVRAVEATPGTVVRTIEQNGSWMVLKNVEQHAEYRRLLDECLDEVAAAVAEREGPMRQREAFIFLSAPNSVTPSHCDPEHNMLLQIRGTKEMHVGRFRNQEVEQRELERIYLGGHRNITQQPDDETCHHLHPGDGVYVRPDAPHYVINGPSVSVSLSITWRTRVTKRSARVHQANGRLRRLNLQPRPPGADPVRDRAKEAASVAVGLTTRTVGRIRDARSRASSSTHA